MNPPAVEAAEPSELPSLADLWDVTLDAPEPEEVSALAFLEDGHAGQWTLRSLKVTPGNRRMVCVFEPGR